MSTGLSHLGHFWLPARGEATALPGALDLGELSVRLDGAITPTGLLEDDVVFARLQGHPGIATLYNCFASAKRRGDGTVVFSKIDTTQVALGAHTENLDGWGIQFVLDGCAQWFNEQNFKIKKEDDSWTFRFTDASTTYTLSPTLSLERYFVSLVPLAGWGDEAFHVQRPMGFRMASTKRLSFDQWWDMMIRLRRFFEFFSRQRMPPRRLEIFNQTASMDRPDVQIFNSALRASEPTKFDWDEQLVMFHDIEDRLPALLPKWIDVHQAHPEPFNRFFDAFDRPRKDPMLHFLWNIAAIEELHKLRTARKDSPLLARLKDICSRWSPAFTRPPTEDVLKQIRDTRNYYTHAAGDLRNNAAKDWVLLRYGDFLAALASLEMLSLLGIDDTDAVRLSDRYWMSQTLALEKYPSH